MNHRERLETIIAGEKPDRVPVALWRHFPVDDQNPHAMADATLGFQKTYDFDLVKVTFMSSYFVRAWGGEDEWRGDPEGTREFTRRPILEPDDWLKLPVLEPSAGVLGEQLECLQILRKNLGPNVPILPTIFSPLSQARKMVGDEVVRFHLRKYPEALYSGLEVIAESTIRFLEAMKPLEMDGIFYAVQHAQYNLHNEEEHDKFSQQFDLDILATVEDLWLNMLHIHGTDIMFHKFIDYPVQVINWHDKETSPSLAEAKDLFPVIVCGGLRRNETMLLGTPEDVESEVKDAIEQTGGRRFILGTGCVLPITVPHGNIMAARRVVEK